MSWCSWQYACRPYYSYSPYSWGYPAYSYYWQGREDAPEVQGATLEGLEYAQAGMDQTLEDFMGQMQQQQQQQQERPDAALLDPEMRRRMAQRVKEVKENVQEKAKALIQQGKANKDLPDNLAMKACMLKCSVMNDECPMKMAQCAIQCCKKHGDE